MGMSDGKNWEQNVRRVVPDTPGEQPQKEGASS